MGADTQLLLWVNQGWANPWLDTLAVWLSARATFSLPLLGLILAALAWRGGRRGVQLWLVLLATVVSGDLLGNLLKSVFAEPRPCFELWEQLRALGGGTLAQCHAPVTGMPSSHALNFFAVALFLGVTLRRVWPAAALAVAALAVGLSRIYLGKHYPSQVLAGAVVGVAWGAACALLTRRFLPGLVRSPRSPPAVSGSREPAGEGPAARFEPLDFGETAPLEPAAAAPAAARDWPALLLLAVGLVGLRALLARWAGLQMHFDEAQYWEWSRHLDWSYYSKGPLVAWLIALSEWLFGHGEWQVRLPAWIAASAFPVLLYAFARDLWGTRAAGWWAVLLGLTTPVYFSLGLVMTTDVFLFLFWTWGLWAAWRALERAQPAAWLELGAAVGLGALTKLSIGLLPAFLGLYVLVTPGRWRHLREPRLWDGLALMVVCMSPVLLWNATHNWVMLRHEAGHVGPEGWGLRQAGEFLAGQWLILSPVVAALAAATLWRRPAEAGRRLVWGVSLLCVAFFVFKSASGKVQLNWAAAAYVGLLVLFAGHITDFGRRRRQLLAGGILLSLAILLAGLFPGWLGLPADRAPLHRMRAWDSSVAALAAQAGPVDFLLAGNYKEAAWLAFYWPQEIPVYETGRAERRFNQRDLWPGLEREAGRTGLYVSTAPAVPAELAEAFATCTPLPPVPALDRNGGTVRTLHAHRCSGYRPIRWPVPGSY